MYGFLNLLLAAGVAAQGATTAEVREVLEERTAAAFRFDDEGAHWKSRFLSVPELQRLRSRVAVSFGSCSFTEPLNDLRFLSYLR